jgi:hypothetical protein
MSGLCGLKRLGDKVMTGLKKKTGGDDVRVTDEVGVKRGLE